MPEQVLREGWGVPESQAGCGGEFSVLEHLSRVSSPHIKNLLTLAPTITVLKIHQAGHIS